jgi:hypothetical protein
LDSGVSCLFEYAEKSEGSHSKKFRDKLHLVLKIKLRDHESYHKIHYVTYCTLEYVKVLRNWDKFP